MTLTIDDREVSVAKGTLIIRAAEQAGIEIPRFCDHPLLEPVGACRQCLVEVWMPGRPGPDGTPGEPQKLAEYYAVSEDRLKALPAEKLAELRDNGALGQIYAHLVSLLGWDRLIALAFTRAPQVVANA